jgi:hypothetical protein
MDLRDWSEKDIAYLLETGQTPEGDFVGSSMKEVIWGTSQLPPEERAAMASYVKSLQAIEGPKRSMKSSSQHSGSEKGAANP